MRVGFEIHSHAVGPKYLPEFLAAPDTRRSLQPREKYGDEEPCGAAEISFRAVGGQSQGETLRGYAGTGGGVDADAEWRPAGELSSRRLRRENELAA